MELLDVLVRLCFAVGLVVALVTWGLVFTGRYRPGLASPEAQATSDRLQPYAIGLLGVAALVELASSEGRGSGVVLLAVLALVGWTQDRARLRAALQ